MVRTRSVAVAPLGSSPDRRNPTTFGMSMDTGWPSIAASASMPPTPQPSTPRPFWVVVGQFGWDEGVDLPRVAAQRPHSRAHSDQVDNGRDTGKVLQDHPDRGE